MCYKCVSVFLQVHQGDEEEGKADACARNASTNASACGLGTVYPVPLPKLPSYARPEHAYSLPDNTAGEAKQRKRRRGAAATVVHADQLVGDEPIDRDMQSSASSYDFPFMEPPFPSSIITLPPTMEDESLPRTTAWRKKRRHDLGQTTKKLCKNAHNYCGTCGQPKTKETGHSCLRGYVFCQLATVSHREWSATQVDEVMYTCIINTHIYIYMYLL